MRLPMWKNSRANPKTPGGVHVTGPPSRVPLWLAPVVFVAVRVSRPVRDPIKYNQNHTTMIKLLNNNIEFKFKLNLN